MNPTTLCPLATIDGNEYRWYDLQALFVKNHDLRSEVWIYNSQAPSTPTFYLAEGLRNDTYQKDGMKGKVVVARCKMFLHSENIDLDLDGSPDCEYPPEYDCSNVDFEALTCDESILEAWRAGYSEYFDQVRLYTEDVRTNENNLYAITNGFPDTLDVEFQGETRKVAGYLNGRYYEDANGGVKDTLWYYNPAGALRRAVFCDTSPIFKDPRYTILIERDRTFDEYTETNLAQMRLTMAVSLMLDDGYYITTGGGSSRSELFDEDPPIHEIEDYYDEYAVDFEGRGYRNLLFQDVFWDEEENPLYRDEGLLLEVKYYLGEPKDTIKVYPDHYGDLPDMIYREYDHGAVLAHLADCEFDQASSEYDFDVTLADWVDSPMDKQTCRGDECHFMRILGGPWLPPDDMYNDGKNNGEHPVHQLWVDPLDDDETYGRGDAIILLKENDGFKIHEDHGPP